MRRIIVATVLGMCLAGSVASPAWADSTGYEGQPGNQSNGGNHGNNGNGPSGYEGQPGGQAN